MADSNPTTQPSVEETRDEDIDATQEVDTSAETTQPDSMNIDGANDARPAEEDEVNKPIEARIPAKKDATLREFLGKMDDYAPIVWFSIITTVR
jgi:transcription initiation factor TFIID subunit 10